MAALRGGGHRQPVGGGHPLRGIYSQTYALYQDVNFRYWFTDKEIQQLRGHVQQFEVPRPEYELILTYYRKPVGLERGVYTTSSQIIGRFGNTSLRLSLQKVGRAMRELGFRQVKASNANYWVVVERTTEEVQHLLPAEAEQANPPAKSLPRRIPNSPSDTLSEIWRIFFKLSII